MAKKQKTSGNPRKKKKKYREAKPIDRSSKPKAEAAEGFVGKSRSPYKMFSAEQIAILRSQEILRRRALE